MLYLVYSKWAAMLHQMKKYEVEVDYLYVSYIQEIWEIWKTQEIWESWNVHMCN